MSLEPQDARLLRLSAAICSGSWGVLRELRRAAPAGEPDRGWREAVLQAHLFAGFPRVVEACEVLAGAGGLGAPEAEELRVEADLDLRGRALFDAVYGDHGPAVSARLQAHHPVLARWIEGHAYGRVLGRGGLSPARRELLAVVCLAVLDQERQLAAHIRGALRLGATAEELGAALDAVADLLDEEALRRARELLVRFADRA